VGAQEAKVKRSATREGMCSETGRGAEKEFVAMFWAVRGALVRVASSCGWP